MMQRRDIRLITPQELVDIFESWDEPKFRAQQVLSWLWQKGTDDIGAMSNLSKSLREKLSLHFEIRAIRTNLIQTSSDGTIKTRFQLYDGHFIESVLIPVPRENRYTVCVSSQVGCSLSCKFCATGRMKRERNLDPGEIYDQVFMVNQQSLEHFDHPLTNIVYMGMGEPLLAYKSVLESISLITSPEGLGMSPRRITVSTAGIAKMISKLADEKVKFNLALSLHAANDQKRNDIMPINEHNNLEALMAALKEFHHQTRSKLSFEYIAFHQFNDTLEDAAQLAKLCKHFPVRVNIIEYNPIDSASYSKSSEDRIDAFAAYLVRKGVTTTVRRSRGKDIDAACGQLANK
jgi:23S rRNA (adenine2503-C2)-methyltransferase